MEFCEDSAYAIIDGAGFTVYCWLFKEHAGDHESPDFTWADGDTRAVLK